MPKVRTQAELDGLKRLGAKTVSQKSANPSMAAVVEADNQRMDRVVGLLEQQMKASDDRMGDLIASLQARPTRWDITIHHDKKTGRASGATVKAK